MEHIYGGLVPIMAVFFTFGIPTLVIIVLERFRHKQHMELIRQGINPDSTIPAYPGNKSLLGGLVFTGIGLALVVAKLVTGDYHDLAGGIILLGAGIAFFAFWKLTAPDRDRRRRQYEEYYAIRGDADRTTGTTPQVRENAEITSGR